VVCLLPYVPSEVSALEPMYRGAVIRQPHGREGNPLSQRLVRGVRVPQISLGLWLMQLPSAGAGVHVGVYQPLLQLVRPAALALVVPQPEPGEQAEPGATARGVPSPGMLQFGNNPSIHVVVLPPVL
jgi:hypothetical protein